MRVINEGEYRNSSIDFDFGINFKLGKKKKKIKMTKINNHITSSSENS